MILLNISYLNVALIRKNRGFLEQSPNSKAVPRRAPIKKCSENMQQIYKRLSILLETPGNFRSFWKLLQFSGFWKRITNSPGSLQEVFDFFVSKICFGKVYCRYNVVSFFECVCIVWTSHQSFLLKYVLS